MINPEDRFAIFEVFAQYFYSNDARDADGFVNLFVESTVQELYYSGQKNQKSI